MENKRGTRLLFLVLLATLSVLVPSMVSASQLDHMPSYLNGGADAVPFKGTMQGTESDSQGPSPTTLVVTTTGDGIGTHLGQFSFTQQATVDLVNGTETGWAHWVAANGDSIDATFVGSGELLVTPDGVVISITEVFTISGGSGRFDGAQGSFTMERLASPVTFLTSGSFHGTITSPGEVH